MGLDQIIAVVKANLAFLPNWFTSAFWHLVSAILIVYLLTVLFKAISDSAFINPIKGAASLLLNIAKAFLSGTFKAIQTPIERPRTKLAVKVGAVIHSYLMCVLFFGLFLFVAFLYMAVGFAPEIHKQLGGWGLMLLFFYLAVFFRAEADRDWLAMKEQWKVVRRGSNA